MQPTPSNTNTLGSPGKIVWLVYILQLLSFIFIITCFAAIIINYVKRDDLSTTWYASHCRWQIRTFWFSVLWGCVGFILSLILIGHAILFIVPLWFLYRVIKGMFRLYENKPMYT